jgi:hypothetical protein
VTTVGGCDVIRGGDDVLVGEEWVGSMVRVENVTTL